MDAHSSDIKPRLDLRFSIEHRGYHHGQNDYTIVARHVESGEVAGYMDYTVFRGEIFVGIVEVSIKRRGIATQLYERVLEEHPDAQLGHSTKSEDGVAFRLAFDESHRDRVSLSEQDRPAPFSEREWASALAAHAHALAQYGIDSDQALSISEMLNVMHGITSGISTRCRCDLLQTISRPDLRYPATPAFHVRGTHSEAYPIFYV
jgi:hypothetical protein